MEYAKTRLPTTIETIPVGDRIVVALRLGLHRV
jgi:hypothetical protein